MSLNFWYTMKKLTKATRVNVTRSFLTFEICLFHSQNFNLLTSIFISSFAGKEVQILSSKSIPKTLFSYSAFIVKKEKKKLPVCI